MNLLLNRDQVQAALFSLVPLRIGSGVTFSLHATLELDAEEDALLKKYKLTNAPLVVSDPIEDIKQSLRPAMILGFVAFVVIWLITSFGTAIGFGILTTLVMTGVYFKTLREQINVNDLLVNGRKFRCDSIVELVRKEAYLENICAYLRQVLESAKHWDDREVVSIRPLSKEDAKRALL